MSCFFTAAHTLLNNVKEKQMSLADNFKELKAMLVGVGKHSGGEEDAPAGDLEVEIPRPASVPFPPPLDEGIDAEVYEAFANAQPPSESQKTENEIAVKLREEENAIIARINRVHNEAED
nr:hypothetical protein BaRGS_013287 [Batillaria attramentaria]